MGLGRLGLLASILDHFSVAVSNGPDLGFSQNFSCFFYFSSAPLGNFFLSDGHKSGYFHDCPSEAEYLNF
jgi:hypothetical protein